jgi:proteasome accessory factor A
VTGLVLRVVEASVVLWDITLDNPITAIREVSRDTTGHSRVRISQADCRGSPAP